MGRWSLVLAAMGLLIAACSGSDAADSTTPTSTSSSSTTTATVATTTTVAAADETIESPVTEWGLGEVGQFTSDALAPAQVTFQVDEPGWFHRGSGDRWIQLGWDADGDGASDAQMALLLYSQDLSLEAAFDEIVSIEGIERTGDIVEGNAATFTSLGTAIDGLPQADRGGGDDCSGANVRWQLGGQGGRANGYVLVEDGNNLLGIPSCEPSVLWVVDTGLVRVAVIGVARFRSELAGLQPGIQRFVLNSVTFGNADE